MIKHIIIIIIGLSFLLSCSNTKVVRTTKAQADFPTWITKRPVVLGNYIGIGAAKVSADGISHIDLAKNNALNDLVGDIEITISSNSIIRQFENEAGFMEEFQSLSNASIKDHIKGYELVASWGDDQHYWVYYSLSKLKYREIKEQQLNLAKSLALDFYQKGLDQQTKKDMAGALHYYLKGLNELKYFLDEEINASINGRTILLNNELLSATINILSRTKIRLFTDEITAKMVKPLDSTIRYQVVYQANNQEKLPMKSLPIKTFFNSGDGQITQGTTTDANGNGYFKVGRITGLGKFQEVIAAVDIQSMLANDKEKATIVEKLLSIKSSVPIARLSINVAPVIAFYDADEIDFGERSVRATVSNEIKRMISAQNFTWSTTKESADLIVAISAKATKGKYNSNFNLYTVYIDSYLSIYDQNTGNKVFFKGFDQVRGQQVESWNNALKEAEATLLEKYEKEVMPGINQLVY